MTVDAFDYRLGRARAYAKAQRVQAVKAELEKHKEPMKVSDLRKIVERVLHKDEALDFDAPQ